MFDEEKNASEERIRERAYALWQEAGCPEGRDHEFWHQAEELENSGAGSDVDEAAEDSFPASDPANRT